MIKVPARFPRGIEARSRSLPRRRLAVPAGIAALVVLCFGQGVVPEPGFTSQAHAQAMPRPVGFADIVDKVKPAVISVRVNIVAGRQARGNSPFPQDSPLDRFFRRFAVPDGTPDNSQGQRRNRVTGQGSGFFISADGYAVTNFHVVENTDSVEVTTDDGRIFKAKVIGADQRSDIALIKIDGGGGFPFVRFAEASPRIGDWVIAVGNPFGLGGSVTAGIVSARGRDIGAGPYDDFIQIDAAVN
jgi:serine protease Do